MLNIKKENLFHNFFLIGIFIKAIDGIFELIGGTALLIFKSTSLNKIIQKIFNHELAQDPTDVIANFLIKTSQDTTDNTLLFIAIYLIIHGSTKIGLVLGLWSKKMWIYPVAGITLTIFVIYQIVKIINTHSIILLFLTLIDILIIILLKFEYERIKKNS